MIAAPSTTKTSKSAGGVVECSANSRDDYSVVKNLVVLCTGFPLMFCAYKALANLQSTLNQEKSIGVISQSVIYAGFVVSSLLLPNLFIRKIGCKRTLVLCILAYCPYLAANAYPSFGTVLPTSVLLGLAAGPLWSAQSVYLTDMSRRYAVLAGKSEAVILSLFFGLFSTAYGTTDVWGNLVSYYILSMGPEYSNDNDSSNASASPCGIDFCSSEGTQTNHNLDPPNETERYLLVGIYFLISVLSALIIALFLDPLPRDESKELRPRNHDVLAMLGATFKNLRKTEQLLLVPITVFSGAERAFFISEFTRGYIACTWGIYHIGYVCICYGAVTSVCSLLSGYSSKFLPRPVILTLGFLADISACVAMILWQQHQYHVLFVVAALWALGDAVFHTHLKALYGILFQGEEEGAFSNFLLWESVGNVIFFSSSAYLCMKVKVSMIVIVSVAGIVAYYALENTISRSSKK